MDVELLYFDDCPNWEAAAAVLDQVAAERDDVTIRRHHVRSDEEARRLGFHGSPSIHVNGVDLFAPAVDTVSGRSCRVYRGEHGFSGAPSLDQVRAAIAALADDGPHG